jgi:hypothetical protein
LKALDVHLGLGRPHNSRQSPDCFELSKDRRVFHPAHNPEVASNDFVLLGDLKANSGERTNVSNNSGDLTSDLSSCVFAFVNGRTIRQFGHIFGDLKDMIRTTPSHEAICAMSAIAKRLQH